MCLNQAPCTAPRLAPQIGRMPKPGRSPHSRNCIPGWGRAEPDQTAAIAWRYWGTHPILKNLQIGIRTQLG